MINPVFGKRKCNKIQRYQAYNNQKKKELFGIRTNYYTKKQFSETLLTTELKKKKKVISKAGCLALSIL